MAAQSEEIGALQSELLELELEKRRLLERLTEINKTMDRHKRRLTEIEEELAGRVQLDIFSFADDDELHDQ